MICWARIGRPATGSGTRRLAVLLVLVLALVAAACGSGSTPAATDPTNPTEGAPAATPSAGSTLGDSSTPAATGSPDGSPTPSDVLSSAPSTEAVLEAVSVALGSTDSLSGSYVFNSDTDFPGGEVSVVVDGLYDPGQAAVAFDTQIVAPDENGDPAASLRSYLVTDAGAWFLDHTATEWFAFEPESGLDNGRIAQGLFQSLSPAGQPPLLGLLAFAEAPAALLGPAVLGGTEVALYSVTVPMSQAFVALGPSSYQSFLDSGVDIATFRGSVPLEVGIGAEGRVRWIEADMTPIFREVAAQPGQTDASAAVLGVLTVTMKLQLDELGDPVAITEPSLPTPAPEVAASTIAIGQCFVEPELSDPGIEAVDCNVPHLHEVFAILPRAEDADAGYPGFRTLVDDALLICRQAFRDNTAMALETTTVEVAVAYPSRESWAAGDRDVVCSVLYPTPTTFVLGSFDLRRSFGVVTTFGLAAGDCLLATVDFSAAGLPLVDCAQEHVYEVFFAQDLVDLEFPGEDEVRQLAEDLCQEEFVTFVGESVANSPHGVTFFRPSASTWETLGDRAVTCLIEADTPIVGSLGGTAEGE